MTTVVISRTASHVSVQSPYNAGFVAAAKSIAGKWNSPAWVFPIQLENEVRELCIKFYGTDGSVEADLADVRIVGDNALETIKVVFDAQYGDITSLKIAGREVLKIVGRDNGVRLGEDVILREGKLTSGGSAKYPKLVVKDGAIDMQVLNLPRAAAETLASAHPELVTATPVDKAKPEAAPVTVELSRDELAESLAALVDSPLRARLATL